MAGRHYQLHHSRVTSPDYHFKYKTPHFKCISILGRANIVDILLKNGANINATDHINRSPLYLAAENGNNCSILLTKII